MALCYRLPCGAPTVCISEPLCSYYCSSSPGKKPQQIERIAISDAEPTEGGGGGGRGALKMEGRNSDRQTERAREREYPSLQEMQHRDRRGILIIMRTKIL